MNSYSKELGDAFGAVLVAIVWQNINQMFEAVPN